MTAAWSRGFFADEGILMDIRELQIDLVMYQGMNRYVAVTGWLAK